jgi:ATP-binding cassette subfamily C protein CydC
MKPVLLRLIKEARPYWKWMALAILLSFLIIGSGVGLLMTAAYLIARAALHPSIADLQIAVVGVRFFGLARGIFRYLERYVSHEVTFRLLAGFRVWFYRAIEPLAPARLAAYHSGDLLSRVVADVEQLEHLYVRMIGPPIVAMAMTGTLWLLFGVINVSAAIILVAGLAAAGWGIPLLTQWLSHRTGQRLVTVQAELQVQLLDGLQGMAELTALGQLAPHTEGLHKLSREVLILQRRMSNIVGLHDSLMGLFMNLTVLAVLIAIIPDVTEDRMNGVFLSVLTLGIMAAFEAVWPLPAAFHQYSQTAAAGKRLMELIDAEPSLTPTAAPSPVIQHHAIQFSNIEFQYDQASVLKNFHLEISDGARIAIVGPSGAGKSTLAKLLFRWYEPQAGQILFGGQPLDAFAPEDLPQLITYLPQHPHLFNGTIEENLRMGNPNATAEEIDQCTQWALIDDFIRRLPQQRQTRIGEQGLQLSGGERRRLALARGLLRKTPILILDEPSADLDLGTEQQLFQNLWTQPVAQTIILITHRLVQMEKADCIFCLHDGKIQESGRHEKLLRHNGSYARMWSTQQQDTAVEKL